MTAYSTDPKSDPNLILDIDFAWDPDASGARTLARDLMPTLPDADPLRYDVQVDYRFPARDSLPTLPDSDPLRHDSAAESSETSPDHSVTLRREVLFVP